MKKFFTLIAFAVAALTANAEVVLNSTFEKIVDGVLTEEGNWWYSSSNFGTVDDTDCTYLVMQLSENENGGTYCVYGPWRNEPEGSETWVADHKDISVAAGQKLVAWKISDLKALTNFSWEYSCFVIQAKPNTKCAISKVALMTDAEYEAAVKADAEVEKTLNLISAAYEVALKPSEASSGWNTPGWIGQTGLDALYKTLVFEVTAEHEFAIVLQDWNGVEADAVNHTYLVSGSSTPVIVAVPISSLANPGVGQFAIQNRYITEYNEPSADPKTGEMVDNSVYGQNTVKVSKCYVTSKEVASTYTEWVDSHAGIEEIVADSAASKKAVKVAKDGKIVIVKGNAEFNVAGQLVK